VEDEAALKALMPACQGRLQQRGRRRTLLQEDIGVALVRRDDEVVLLGKRQCLLQIGAR